MSWPNARANATLALDLVIIVMLAINCTETVKRTAVERELLQATSERTAVERELLRATNAQTVQLEGTREQLRCINGE